jgi:Zn ribbon nucleic-acid-binding protein
MRYSNNQKARSTNETYPDSYNSFSMGVEKSVDAVECVICDKPINRDQFHDHLEEHKGRRK